MMAKCRDRKPSSLRSTSFLDEAFQILEEAFILIQYCRVSMEHKAFFHVTQSCLAMSGTSDIQTLTSSTACTLSISKTVSYLFQEELRSALLLSPEQGDQKVEYEPCYEPVWARACELRANQLSTSSGRTLRKSDPDQGNGPNKLSRPPCRLSDLDGFIEGAQTGLKLT